MKKIAMFIASNGFREEEYNEPKKIIESAGIHLVTVSSRKGDATGKFGGKARADIKFSEVEPEAYDGLFLVGGPGALRELDNKSVHGIFTKAAAMGKLFGAICISSVVLAHAGLLKGKKATVWPDGKPELVSGGAEYIKEPCVRDGNLITADGPRSAVLYGEAIVAALKQ